MKTAITKRATAILLVLILAMAVPLMARSADDSLLNFSHCCHHEDPLVFIDPVTGETWVAIDSRACEHHPWGIDILYARTDDGVEKTRWECYGVTTLGDNRTSRSSELFSEITRHDFSAFELNTRLIDGSRLRIDGTTIEVNSIEIDALSSGGCTRPTCNGRLEWIISWTPWFPSEQRECTHFPWGFDVLFNRTGGGSLICEWCSAFHGSGNFTDREWRCQGRPRP